MFIVIKSEHYDCTNLICKKDTLEEAVAAVKDSMAQRISDTPVSRCEAMHRAEDCIRNELEAYSDYLAGNCWQYCITDEDGNVVDSCSAFLENEAPSTIWCHPRNSCLLSLRGIVGADQIVQVGYAIRRDDWQRQCDL